jgi:hypothetical protein
MPIADGGGVPDHPETLVKVEQPLDVVGGSRVDERAYD